MGSRSSACTNPTRSELRRHVSVFWSVVPVLVIMVLVTGCTAAISGQAETSPDGLIPADSPLVSGTVGPDGGTILSQDRSLSITFAAKSVGKATGVAVATTQTTVPAPTFLRTLRTYEVAHSDPLPAADVRVTYDPRDTTVTDPNSIRLAVLDDPQHGWQVLPGVVDDVNHIVTFHSAGLSVLSVDWIPSPADIANSIGDAGRALWNFDRSVLFGDENSPTCSPVRSGVEVHPDQPPFDIPAPLTACAENPKSGPGFTVRIANRYRFAFAGTPPFGTGTKLEDVPIEPDIIDYVQGAVYAGLDLSLVPAGAETALTVTADAAHHARVDYWLDPMNALVHTALVAVLAVPGLDEAEVAWRVVAADAAETAIFEKYLAKKVAATAEHPYEFDQMIVDLAADPQYSKAQNTAALVALLKLGFALHDLGNCVWHLAADAIGFHQQAGEVPDTSISVWTKMKAAWNDDCVKLAVGKLVAASGSVAEAIPQSLVDFAASAVSGAVRDALEAISSTVASKLGLDRTGLIIDQPGAAWLFEKVESVSAVGPSGTKRAVAISGQDYPNSTSLWVGCDGPPAVTQFTLGGRYSRLDATLTLDTGTPASLAVTFKVSADGTLLNSWTLKPGASQVVGISIAGAQRLEISTQAVGGTCATASVGYGIAGDAALS